MKKILNLRTFCPVIIIGLAGLICFTLHDICTAQGIGLYWAMLCGSENRLPFDIATDVIGVVLFLSVLVLPCIFLKYKKTDSLLRLMVVYLAFMPAISPGMLVHLFDGHALWKVEFDWMLGLNSICDLSQIVLPFLCILGFLYKADGFGVKRWQKVSMAVMPILFVGVMTLPELSQILLQFIYYLAVLVTFDWWEKLYAKAEKNERLVWGLLFGGFCAKGCLCMLELMSATHL